MKVEEGLFEGMIPVKLEGKHADGAEYSYQAFSVSEVLGSVSADSLVEFISGDGRGKKISIPETFETLGTAVLKKVKDMPEKTVVIDELGKAEADAPGFQEALFSCLDTQSLVIGVLQKNTGAFTQAVAERPDVKVFEVTEKNRDSLLEVIFKNIKKWNKKLD